MMPPRRPHHPPHPAIASAMLAAATLLPACTEQADEEPLPEIVLTDSNPGRDISPGAIRKPVPRSQLNPEGKANPNGGRDIAIDLTPLSRSEDDWRRQLSDQAFAVTRLGQTEPPGTGELLHNQAPGLYRCVCCKSPLFASEAKYDSGSGWPAFWGVINQRAIDKRPDESLGLNRTEVRCARCQAHLGHLFAGGPEPTGLWYCINSAALSFDPDVDLDSHSVD